jgi:FixJ family two-component response regulator
VSRIYQKAVRNKGVMAHVKQRGWPDRLGLVLKRRGTHRANAMRKLELHSITDLVRYATKNKIVEA